MTDKFIFLKKDYDGLVKKINNLKEDYKKWGKSSTEGSKVGDWHDNFAYEESMRQMKIISDRIQEFKDLLRNAQLFDESEKEIKSSKIVLGSKVKLETPDGDVKKYSIGSYRIFREEEFDDDYQIISYSSPLGNKLLGRAVDDQVELRIEGKQFIFDIIDIQ